MSQLVAQLAENLAEVRGRIAAAAARSGRPADQISLVAVTKYVGSAEVRALVEAGCTLLGESRPQELWEKAQSLRELPVRWHLVGHLQRNKVRRTLPLVEMIESVDSPRLVAAIDRIAGELSRQWGASADAIPRQPALPILLEVNVSGEPAKHGFQPAALEACLGELAGYGHVEIRGLMCLAGLEGDAEAARRDFARLRHLRDRLREHCPQGIVLNELSMGMSGDYELAIEEGATIVRIGSALFRGVL